jgi:hypothetical protein
MDSIFQEQRFKDACNSILTLFAYKPFLCTSMSVCLFAGLEHDFPDRSLKIKTGDLLYGDCIIFKQNYAFAQDESNVIKAEWDGHCWVELDDRYIIDISLFRTIYSDNFTKSCKQDILNAFGLKRGLLIVDKQDAEFINSFPLKYIEHNILHDKIIDGILKAVDENKAQFFNQ